jgi:hypothetical protein
MDLLLAPAEDGVHTVLWTGALLDEWERVIVRSGRRSASSAAAVTAAAVTAAVRKYFPDAEVPLDGYADLVLSMPGKDPDDRVHHSRQITSRSAGSPGRRRSPAARRTS